MTRQDKKAQFETKRVNRKPLLILVAVLVAAGAVAAWSLLSGGAGNMQTLRVENGRVRVAQSDLADGQARFYKVAIPGGEVSFFLVKSRDGVIRAAFDTCDVCYKERKGYRQEGDNMVCNNCNQTFRSDLINVVKGGCNPVPLVRELRGDQVVIELAALGKGHPYFN